MMGFIYNAKEGMGTIGGVHCISFIVSSTFYHKKKKSKKKEPAAIRRVLPYTTKEL